LGFVLDRYFSKDGLESAGGMLLGTIAGFAVTFWLMLITGLVNFSC
jgi:hypothetical protein